MNTAEKGISGWELNNPDPELFDTRILEVSGSCSDCEHLDRCCVPSESIRCLVPKEGHLIEFHQEYAQEGKYVTYFALVRTEDMRFIKLCEPEHYWANAFCVAREDVPVVGLSRLSQKLGQSP